MWEGGFFLNFFHFFRGLSISKYIMHDNVASKMKLYLIHFYDVKITKDFRLWQSVKKYALHSFSFYSGFQKPPSHYCAHMFVLSPSPIPPRKEHSPFLLLPFLFLGYQAEKNEDWAGPAAGGLAGTGLKRRRPLRAGQRGSTSHLQETLLLRPPG